MALPRKALKLKVVGERPERMDHGPLTQWMTARDESAFAFFYDATSGLLFGLLLLTLGDTATAEEALAEVYDEIREQVARVARRPAFENQHEYLLNWLITTAHRHAFDRLRANRSDRRFTVSRGGQQGLLACRTVDMSTADHRELVSATLASLSPTQRKMIALAYFSRRNPQEIALKLGEPVEKVKVGLQDGMLKLYTLFKDIPAERSLDRRSVPVDLNHEKRGRSPLAEAHKPSSLPITRVRSTR